MRFFSCLLLGVLLAASALAAEYPKHGEDIYDPTADANILIADALATAKTEQRHVLLMFGANWCIWCHRLHGRMQSSPEIATALARDYVLVMVDVNTRKGVKRNADVVERYGNPTQHGLPVFVVLDTDGQPLVTQETGSLEDGEGHSPAKVTAFLAQWAPAR
ncbi:MAG: hypothetical protein RIS54_581 [Verrucomicrobiota bacterium]|jgi:thioredoxin-related protein